MSAVCPLRHLPFSQWRLKIYTDLFTLGTLSRSRNPRSNLRRHRPRTYGTDNSPGHSQSIDGEHSNISRSRLSQTKDGPRGPRKKWSPYSKKGREDLKSLANAFQNLGHKPIKFVELPDLPQSPIFKKALGRKEPAKRQPLPEERVLENDPWAAILAAPVRICNATRVRLPIPLLSNWGLVKLPESGDVYVLPDSLANLEKLEQMGDRQLDQSIKAQEMAKTQLQSSAKELKQSSNGQVEQNRDEVEMEGLPNVPQQESALKFQGQGSESDSRVVPIKSTALYPGSTAAIRLLPSTQVIQLLTDQFTKPEDHEDPSSPRVMKPYAGVIRILPQHWRERIGRAHHFENRRKEIENATGVKDFRDEPMMEATIGSTNLKWQPDIEDRLLDILRRRVLISVSKVLKVATSCPNKVKRRFVTASPKLLDVLKNGGAWKSVVGESAMNQVEKPAHDDSTSTGNVLEDDDAFSSHFFPDIPAEPRDESAARSSACQYVPPRVLLHLSPDHLNSSLINLPTPPILGSRSTLDKDESEDASQKSIPLLPPLLAVSPKAVQEAQYTPVFPLHAMLGGQRYKELLEAMRPCESLFQSDETEQLVAIRASASYSDVLFTEIWRLWRYVGGRKCMQEPEPEVARASPQEYDLKQWKRLRI